LLAGAPELIIVSSASAAMTAKQVVRAIPIVFVNVGDPVTGGLVANIAQPEGNITGITNLFQSVSGKWLELLIEASPSTTTVALTFMPGLVAESYFAAIDDAARVLGIRTIRVPFHDATSLERAISAFASMPNGGLVVVPPAPTPQTRAMLHELTVRYRLPTIYGAKSYAREGALLSYGSELVDTYRTAAAYVDRILRGAKPGDLPIQFPTKLELVVNLKTAKAIGLTIPESFLLRADEVIE